MAAPEVREFLKLMVPIVSASLLHVNAQSLNFSPYSVLLSLLLKWGGGGADDSSRSLRFCEIYCVNPPSIDDSVHSFPSYFLTCLFLSARLPSLPPTSVISSKGLLIQQFARSIGDRDLFRG